MENSRPGEVGWGEVGANPAASDDDKARVAEVGGVEYALAHGEDAGRARACQ